MNSAVQSLPGFDTNNRTPEQSDALRAESRARGELFQPLLDVECAAEACGRVFVPRLPEQEYCTRHRIRGGE